jgi:hypothetical protein
MWALSSSVYLDSSYLSAEFLEMIERKKGKEEGRREEKRDLPCPDSF